MIALNREMPKNCLECPCMGTYDILNDKNEMYMLRICHGNYMTIYQTTRAQYDENKDIQQEWASLPRPEWCPWIDVGDAGLKWAMTYPDDYDDEERWHHNMAGFGGDY